MKAPKISPANAAKYGHIAALLRQKMEEEKLDIQGVAEKLGGIVSATAVYNWRLAKNGPGPEASKKLAKIFNTSEEDWRARPLETATPTPKPKSNGRDFNGVAYHPTPKLSSTPEICSFTAKEDGTCRLKLDITFTEIEVGAKIFNQLLASGLITKRGSESESDHPEPTD